MRTLSILILLFAGCGSATNNENAKPNNATTGTTNASTNAATNNDVVPECAFDTDCELGRVCQRQDGVCITASCEFCTAEQICYRAVPTEPGSCSAPECTTDDDCTEGSCTDGVCGEPGCISNADCEDGERCNLLGRCE